jgi:hypothetical protein
MSVNAEADARSSNGAMDNFVFRCPQTGLNVQHTWPDEEKSVDDQTYVFVTCPSCTRMHLINRSTGKPLGYKGDSPPGGQKK